MIFITLGSQKFQFNRLLKAIDEQIECGVIKDKVFAQIGYSSYKPQNYEFKQFLDRDDFEKTEKLADIIITHGGTGAIIGAVKQEKKVIAVPRRAKYGEHVDDHQLQLVGQFRELNLICECRDCGKINEALEYVRSHEFSSYESNTHTIIESIENFISREVKR